MDELNIQKSDPAYQRLAAALREQITAGRIAPGALLPSEASLTAQSGLSRPTVRKAIERLAIDGWVVVRPGKGAIVRGQDRPEPPTASIDRDLPPTRRRRATQHPQWQRLRPATTYRTPADDPTAATLGIRPREECIVCDQLLTTPAGVRVLRRAVLPQATAAHVPALAAEPDTDPDQAHAALSKACGPLTVREQVTARAPLPDEAADLGMVRGVPLVVATRTTHRADATGAALMLETTSLAADTAQLSYTLRPADLR